MEMTSDALIMNKQRYWGNKVFIAFIYQF